MLHYRQNAKYKEISNKDIEVLKKKQIEILELKDMFK